MNTQQPAVLTSQHKKQIAILIIGALIILCGFILLFMLPSGEIAKDGKITDRGAKIIKTDVAKLIQTPQEEPVMALVTNADVLIAEQRFYQGVHNGDVLIIYPQARKAILYSPTEHRLVNVGPVNIGEATRGAVNDPTSLNPAPAPTSEQAGEPLMQ